MTINAPSKVSRYAITITQRSIFGHFCTTKDKVHSLSVSHSNHTQGKRPLERQAEITGAFRGNIQKWCLETIQKRRTQIQN